MKKLILAVCIMAMMAACRNNSGLKSFTISGEIKNIPDQKIYLEEIFFNQQNPEVLDTAEIKNGKFSISADAATEGFYRLRLSKDKVVFPVINDRDKLTLTADMNNLTMKSVQVNSPANAALKKLLADCDTKITDRDKTAAILEATSKSGNDSMYNALQKELELKDAAFEKYLISFVDTCSHPIVALFALGYTEKIQPAKLEKTIASLTNRFKGNAAVTAVATQFNQALEQQKQRAMLQKNIPQPGDIAPEISMPDTEGNTFNLSSLRGKYVLVDFWASWCGPCRQENPNLVNAFNKYKNKNFTILGVSLDREKAAWINAIKKDGLPWKHISDLKFWSSAAVELYHFDGIPYNVLLDPSGKIIAKELRGADLESKLAEVLK